MPHAFSRPTAYVERVLEVVEAIPPGSVMSYGDIAEYLGEGGPRQVGSVMSAWGGAVCWWRVIRTDGTPPFGHEAEALTRYAAESTPMRPSGDRVDMHRARWDGGAPPAHMGQPEDGPAR
ncbi:MGMT family protein [Streptomonospora algeriensis]|uniref:MGMT family protein n=1 Tax=Streptomonospora algeriensis TaxID=995084 RepID=A0ABW3BCL8_9ACTN